MPDQVHILMRVGSWMDENNDLRHVGDIEMLPLVPTRDAFIGDTLMVIREHSLEPWRHEFTEHSYYANASGESWQLLVDLAPTLETLADPDTARTIAGAFLGALLGRLLHKPDWPSEMMKSLDAEGASQRVVDYMVSRDDLAPSAVAELSVAQMEDGSFEILVRRETDGHLFLFRVEGHGFLAGRVDLTELETFAERRSAPPETQVDTDAT